MRQAADIDGEFRYTLDRIWREDIPPVLFVMLNPSTADSSKDDPTIRKCIGFAMRWGFGGFRVVNLFAYRCTSPAKMFSKWTKDFSIIGERNTDVLIEAVDTHELVVAAWGNDGAKFPAQSLAAIFAKKNPKCLHINGSGQPAHPLYQPYGRALIEYPIDLTSISESAGTPDFRETTK